MSESFKSSYATDLHGKVFGKLRVIGFHSMTPHAVWNCVCDCGKARKVRGTRLICGKVAACARCALLAAAKLISDKNRLPDEEAIFNELFRQYTVGAKTRGLEISITREEAIELFRKNCHYCGGMSARKSKARPHLTSFLANGIDRLDSNAGYVKSNVVPCCTVCNFAKREMSERDFLSWVTRVYRCRVVPQVNPEFTHGEVQNAGG